jgi:hypothetical protein
LQPWRALLAVAAWLDSEGVPGLWQRMEALSVSYQNERPDLETSDLTLLVIRALLEFATSANLANFANLANLRLDAAFWDFTSAQIAERAGELIKVGESWIDPEDKHFSKRVGMLLHKLRIDKPTRPTGRGPRIWRVSLGNLKRLAVAYAMPMPEALQSMIHEGVSSEVGEVGELGGLAGIDDAEHWAREFAKFGKPDPGIPAPAPL